MPYNFDEVIDRRSTKSLKWDRLKTRFGREDVLAMWVADMDFMSPPCVQNALVKRAQHGVYGYAIHDDEFNQAVVNWMEHRHGFEIQPEWIATAIGVVPALTVIVQAFTEPGDGVLIQPPVYYPFKRVIENWDRRVVENPLVERNGKYEIDFDQLEEKAREAKIMFLCSPHNPVGRVWTLDELQRIGEICTRNGVLVVSDEIHSDLVYAGVRHIPFASISDAFAENSITCAAPSKTFNLAGLNTAYVVAKNPDLLRRYKLMLAKASMNEVNIFGIEALAAAYNEGGPWLDELMKYLAGNLEYLNQYIQDNIPEIRVIQPEATYLVWLDCSALSLEKKELDQFLVHEALLALDEGHLFGDEGIGFQRVNIACPRSILEQGLRQLSDAVDRVIRIGR